MKNPAKASSLPSALEAALQSCQVPATSLPEPLIKALSNEYARLEEQLTIAAAQRDAIQNQFLQQEKMASIGQLAAGVAHEINNPIGYVNSNIHSLQGYLVSLGAILQKFREALPQLPDESRSDIQNLLVAEDLDFILEDIPPMLQESLDGISRVKKIVQDLKDFSHPDTGVFVLADIHQGLDAAINIAWNEIKYKAEVRKEYASLPMLYVRESQLNQVFLNLLVNAAHAISEGQGRITIRTNADNHEAWVEIEDTGCGIPPENLPRIFDPFFTTKPVGKGTGLGLSLSHGIIKQHGGRIEVASTPNQGTTFRVILPILSAPPEGEAVEHPV